MFVGAAMLRSAARLLHSRSSEALAHSSDGAVRRPMRRPCHTANVVSLRPRLETALDFRFDRRVQAGNRRS